MRPIGGLWPRIRWVGCAGGNEAVGTHQSVIEYYEPTTLAGHEHPLGSWMPLVNKHYRFISRGVVYDGVEEEKDHLTNVQVAAQQEWELLAPEQAPQLCCQMILKWKNSFKQNLPFWQSPFVLMKVMAVFRCVWQTRPAHTRTPGISFSKEFSEKCMSYWYKSVMNNLLLELMLIKANFMMLLKTSMLSLY